MELPALTREQVRKVDQIAIEDYGVPGIVLMENAGIGAAKLVDRFAKNGLIVILCGSGNNGGDGYVVARHLELLGRSVRLVSLTSLDRLSGDAKTNAVIAERSGFEIQVLDRPDTIDVVLSDATTIVDGMLGTGARGPLRGLYANVVEECANHRATKIALDIPTGVDCDTGEVSDPAFQADHTITFVARKVGFDKGDAASFLGDVSVVPIGAPKRLLDSLR
ncbi:MAG: NAD(P)H-hydrate epimerase [Planctomycetota bacterium]